MICPPRKTYDECVSDLADELDDWFPQDRSEWRGYLRNSFSKHNVPLDAVVWWFETMKEDSETHVNDKYSTNAEVLDNLVDVLNDLLGCNITYQFKLYV